MKPNKKQDCNLYIDSEWDSQTHFLSVQIKYKELCIIYYNEKYKINQEEKFAKIQDFEVKWFPWDFTSKKSIMEDFLSQYNPPEKKIKLFFYFSIVDIYALFGEDYILSLLNPKKSHQDCIFKQTNIRGHFTIFEHDFEIVDLCGWEKGGLSKSLNMVGYDSNYKQKVEEKTQMEKYMLTQEKRKIFFQYACEDVISLEFLQKKMLEKINLLYEQTYGFPKSFLITQKTLPQTMGSVGAQLLDKYIYFKMSLDSQNQFSEQHFQFFDLLNQNMGTKKRIPPRKYNVEKRMSTNRYNTQEQQLLNAGSIQTLVRNYTENSGILNAQVHGGRACREDLNTDTHENIVDIDFVSCYSSGIKEFHYPIGLPTIEARTDQNEIMTLKRFLKENEDELVENLYTITISHQNLTFEQDLLYSKKTTQKELRKKINEKLDADESLKNSTLDSEFILYKKVLKNTILTSDVIKALKQISTSQEWSEILNAQVETACFYRKSDYLPLEEWREHFKDPKNLGTYKFVKKAQSNVDTRSRKWTYIPLEEMIDPLLKERQVCKNKAKNALDPEEKEKYNNQQLFYKNIGNILYGVIASMYFSTSNVVVANVITARARLNIWMVSKTLLTKQSITDGGLYSVLTTVEINEGRKPGLEKLFKIHQVKDLKKTRKGRHYPHIKIKPLGDKTEEEWKQIFREKNQEELEKLDVLATKALEKMWVEKYHLPLHYQVEHKKNHSAFKGFTMHKAHYALLTLDEKEIFKFRGQNEKVENLYKLIARIKLTDQDILLDSEEFQKIYYYEEKSIQSINEYLQEQNDPEKKDSIVIPGRVKVKIKKFNLKCQDILFENEKIEKKVKLENVDFSTNKFLEYSLSQNKISINQFYEEIKKEKSFYLNSL